jgi:hypothetical protein
MRSIFWAICSAVVMAAHGVNAAETETKLRYLHITHTGDSPRVVIADGAAKPIESTPLRERMGFRLVRNEELQLVVVDGNPLAYQYTWKGIERTKTDDYTAAQNFAKTLQAVITSLGTAGAAAAAARQDLASVQRMTRDFKLGSEWTVTARSAQPKDVVQDILDGHGLSGVFYETFAKTIQTLRSKIDQIEPLIKESKVDAIQVRDKVCMPTNDAETPAICDWGISTIADTIEDGYERINMAQFDILTKLGDTSVQKDVRLIALMFVGNHETRVRGMLEAARAFRDKAKRIHQPLTLGTILYSSTDRQDATVEIGELDTTGKPLSTAKKFVFVAEPRSSVKYGFGAAFVYSFVRGREFEAAKSGDAFVIKQKVSSDDYVGRDVAAMLSITPAKWADTGFAPSAQVGLNPEKNKVGLFVGAGFKAYDLLYFGVGISAQQIQRLSVGLAEGQTIASKDELKTTSQFRLGPYLHFTVSLP